MLCFSPEDRWSAKECLKHEVFDSVRDPLAEVEADTVVECNNKLSKVEAGICLLNEIKEFRGR